MHIYTENCSDKLNSILLYAIVAEFLLFGSVWVMLGVSGKLYLLLYWGFVGLALVKLCIQHNSRKEWLLIIGFGIVALFCWRASGDRTPILLMLGVCCSKDVDMDKLIKLDLTVRIFSSAVLILLPILGICEGQILYQGDRVRRFFGWEAANGMGLSFLVICMDWMYLRHRRFRWFDYVGILVLTVFIHETANSRTSELLMLLILLAEAAEKLAEKCRIKIERYRLWAVGCIAALLMDILSFLTAMFLYEFKNEELMSLHGSLISRFQLPGQFYDVHGLTLFGSPYNPEIYDYLDIVFAYLTLHLGIVISVIMLGLLIRTIWYGIHRKDEKFLLYFMFILIRSIVESEHFNMIYASFPVLLGIAVWNREIGGQEDVIW